jgi:diapolycopene oxygenase
MAATAKSKRVVVIGAGLGGMSTAIMLASIGFQVTILEKNAQIGGKLNQLKTQGFSFDLGPSIFTLPQVFRPIFEGDGKRFEDSITLQRVDPQLLRRWIYSGPLGESRADAHGTRALRPTCL